MKLDNFMLESTVQLSKIISSQIAKVKIYVLYAGKNRNHTHFSKAMIEEKLVPSMYGMPIIGEFNKDKNDFGGHGGKTTITDDGIEFEQTTVAYGFIPESSQIRWESVKEVNGTYRDYLVCDAYVWYKRFPELQTMLDEPKGQSMEIEIKDAYWNEGLQAYDITDAEFAGACILGVEPCFESAKIGRFSLEKMKYDLAEMAQELKEAIKSEVKTEVKEFENMETEETTVKRLPKEDENAVVVEEDSQEPEQEEEEEAEPDSSKAEEEEVEESKEPAKEEQEEAESEEEAVETVESEVEAEPEQEVEAEQAEESTDEVDADADVDAGAEFSKEQIQAMQQELEELRAFKNAQERVQKEQIMESFESELTAEELAPIKENLDNLTTVEVETQCFALLGKKKMNFSVAQPTVNKEVVAIGSNFAQEDNTLPAWARAIQKHTSKRQ